MKYALVLENSASSCNGTAILLATMGYMITPVFSARKALHAAHMIQFDLIVTCTVVNPDDRRSLTGELKRCSPDAILVLLLDPQLGPPASHHMDGVSAAIQRPLSAESLKKVLEHGGYEVGLQVPPSPFRDERRRRAID